MAHNPAQDLVQARKLFYSRDFLRAYFYFRRFYDRLPFQVTKEHAENIAYFSRTLLELGKEYELKFYYNEIQALYEKDQTLELAYQLAAIQSTGPSWAKDPVKARSLLESIIRNTNDLAFQARSKMLLAYILDTESEDLASCRKLIYSIANVNDPEIDVLVDIWKAKILRDEKNYEEAERQLGKLLDQTPFEINWYAHFSILNILAITYLRKNELKKAEKIHKTLQELFGEKKMCVTRRALSVLEDELRRFSKMGEVTVQSFSHKLEVRFGQNRWVGDKSSAMKHLLLQLFKDRYLDGDCIIQLLFKRKYNPSLDNKTVYYHIHSMRKLFSELGMPTSCLVLENKRYRFIPEVQFVEC